MRPKRNCPAAQGNKKSSQSVKSRTSKQKTEINGSHTTSDQLPLAYRRTKPVYIEHKKVHEGRDYYKVHFDDDKLDAIYLHKDNGINLNSLIKEFNARADSIHDGLLDEMEWEVQEILDSRTSNGKTDFLVKWKHWIGEPSWLNEDDCDCSGLIAAHENPKLRRIYDFNKNNRNLWVDSERMHFYVKRLVRHSMTNVNVLDTRDELCETWLESLENGLNIGCTMFDHHWYVVFIFCNTKCVTRTILLADSLNTTITQKIVHHPILIRLRKTLPGFPIRPIRITQMDRADMCAFYVMAAIERGLFIFNCRAKFIPESIYFHPVRAEYLRSKYAPSTDFEISYSLRTKGPVFTCPTCEFCRREYDDFKTLDAHIVKSHCVPQGGNSSQTALDKILDRSFRPSKYDERLTKSFNDNYQETDD